MHEFAIGLLVAYVVSVIVTPELFNAITAFMLTLNTWLQIRQNRHTRNEIEPKLDEVKTIVDRRIHDEPTDEHRRADDE